MKKSNCLQTDNDKTVDYNNDANLDDLETILNSIKVRFFFGKNIEKKYLGRHDKIYYFFCKSSIPVIDLIVGSRNMIKDSKKLSL